MKRSATVLASIAALSASILLAPPAQAATCTVRTIAPPTVAMGLSPVTRTFSPATATDCTVDVWSYDSDLFLVFGARGTQGSNTWTFFPIFANADAGAYDVDWEVRDDAGDTSAGTLAGGFSLKRRTTWGSSFSISPRTLPAGSKFRVRGTIKRADWDAAAYRGYSGRSVQVQFRAPGTTAWVTKKTVTSGTGGAVSTTVTATADRTGDWRLHYGGNSAAGPADTAAAAVTVT